MKRAIIVLALAVASCGPKTETQQAPAGATSTRDLLTAGSAQVCSQQDVRDTFLAYIRPKIEPTETITGADIETGLAAVTYTIDTITLASVDKAISSVSCDANLTIHIQNNSDRTFSVRYTVRPSIEDAQSVVVRSDGSDAADYAALAARSATEEASMARINASSAQPEETASEPEPDPETAANETLLASPSDDQPAPVPSGQGTENLQ